MTFIVPATKALPLTNRLLRSLPNGVVDKKFWANIGVYGIYYY